MRKTLMAAGLVVVLSCPAFAGIIHTPPVTQPPPSTTQEQDAQGNIPDLSLDAETTGVALNLLLNLLALL